MKFRLFLAFCLILYFSTPAIAGQNPAPGKTCPKKGISQIYKSKKYLCVSSKGKLVWGKGYALKNEVINPTPTPKVITPDFITTNLNTIPIFFDYSNSKEIKLSFKVITNLQIDNPVLSLKFDIPRTRWEIPSQTFKIAGTLQKRESSADVTDFTYSFPITLNEPVGNYKLNLEPFTVGGKKVDLANNIGFNLDLYLTRSFWSKQRSLTVEPRTDFEYSSFKNEKFKKTPWVGRNVVLLTIGKDYEPSVMSRILDALDASYETYKVVTKFTPSLYKQYEGKLTIAEMTPETVGCGAACGYLGATGIEIQSPLFQRLYNGVKNQDQFDEPLFYELGRNFWNYGAMNRVLAGNSKDRKWFDINTTGFAVFMRYFTTEVNEIPIGPNDGPNLPGLEFKATMKNLMIEHRDVSKADFANSFYSSKYDGYGFGVYGFWSSLVYYFMPATNKTQYVSSLLESLYKAPTANTASDGVQNFVNALTAATGRNVEIEFYKLLRFEDAKLLKT